MLTRHSTSLIRPSGSSHRSTRRRLTIHFDISHFNVQGLDMDTVIAQLAPHSAHTHVKDERGIAPNHAFLIPGEGEMDYVRYLTAMDTIGYDGYIVVEISLMVQRRPHYDPLTAATTSHEVLSRAFQHAGIEADIAPRLTSCIHAPGCHIQSRSAGRLIG